MKLKRTLKLAVSAVLSVTAIVVLDGKTIAQDSRPRYSSAQPADRALTLPPDTVINVQMNNTLSSRTARVGDKFTATVTVPVYINGQTVIPAGAIVEGRVTQVTPAKRMNRSGTIGIDFDALVFPNGNAIQLVGTLTSADSDTQRRIDDESRVSGKGSDRASVFIGGGGAIGAVLGGIAGGGKGAVLGGVAGAGAGVAGILLSKGEEAQVPSGTPFGVQLKQAIVLRESAISEPGQDPGERSADQPQDRPAERNERSAPVGTQPDYPNRQTPPRNEPEIRNDRSTEDRQLPARNEPEIRNDRSTEDRQLPPRNEPEIRNDRSTEDRQVPPRNEPEIRNESERTTPDASSLPLSAPEMVRRAQVALKEQGYYEGEADGVMNSRTSAALRTYQREHKLQETGDLDPQTAKSLGIMGTSTASDRTADRRREARTESPVTRDPVLANVLSASANRMQDGAISVSITTQANTGGWRWIGEHVVNGDTLEVYARAISPTGMATQVLTRGRIDLTVRDGVQYVRRVVIHSASGDQMIALNGRAEAAVDHRPEPARPSAAPAASATPAASASSLQRKAEDLLSEYQRLFGVRMTGAGVEVDNPSQYREAEIELLFAIDSFVNSAQLYTRFSMSFRDRQSMHGATLAMARQARRTDRVISTVTTRAADSLATKWDSIRQDVLRLMHSYSISSAEIED